MEEAADQEEFKRLSQAALHCRNCSLEQRLCCGDQKLLNYIPLRGRGDCHEEGKSCIFPGCSRHSFFLPFGRPESAYCFLLCTITAAYEWLEWDPECWVWGCQQTESRGWRADNYCCVTGWWAAKSLIGELLLWGFTPGRDTVPFRNWPYSHLVALLLPAGLTGTFLMCTNGTPGPQH